MKYLKVILFMLLVCALFTGCSPTEATATSYPVSVDIDSDSINTTSNETATPYAISKPTVPAPEWPCSISVQNLEKNHITYSIYHFVPQNAADNGTLTITGSVYSPTQTEKKRSVTFELYKVNADTTARKTSTITFTGSKDDVNISFMGIGTSASYYLVIRNSSSGLDDLYISGDLSIS